MFCKQNLKINLWTAFEKLKLLEINIKTWQLTQWNSAESIDMCDKVVYLLHLQNVSWASLGRPIQKVWVIGSCVSEKRLRSWLQNLPIQSVATVYFLSGCK